MEKLSNTEAELKKSIAYKKKQLKKTIEQAPGNVL